MLYGQSSTVSKSPNTYYNITLDTVDDYYPNKHKIEYELSHVHNWLSLFVFMRNADIPHIKFMNLIRIMIGEKA
jgi:hypothetical protein